MSLDTWGRVTPLQYLYTRATNSNLAEDRGLEPRRRLNTRWLSKPLQYHYGSLPLFLVPRPGLEPGSPCEREVSNLFGDHYPTLSLCLVREAGLEPASLAARDFKSLVYTIPPLSHYFSNFYYTTFSSCCQLLLLDAATGLEPMTSECMNLVRCHFSTLL